MRSDTKTVVINASLKDVFCYIADPAHLPEWAIGFCKGIRREGDVWIVRTGQGDMEIRYVTDPGNGVIDYHILPAPGADLPAFSRVVPHGDGKVEYIFTQLQFSGMPDHVFDGQVRALEEELQVLKARLEGKTDDRRIACPADGR